MTKTIGQQLRQIRQGRELTLEQVSKATRIRVHYLQAMEAGNFDALPSPIQARGFLRLYADYLGMDPEPLLVSLSAQASGEPTTGGSSKLSDGTQPTKRPVGSDATQPGTRTVEGTDGSLAGDENFKQIGQKLRRQRELLGLSLEDVIRHTHLRSHYLQALESGGFDNLPSPVQGRGMLKNYAVFLGLDPDPLLLTFADGIQARYAARQPERSAQSEPQPLRRPSILRRIFSGDLLWMLFIVVVLVGFVGWGLAQVLTINSEKPVEPTAPSIAEVLAPDETATATITQQPAATQNVVALPTVGELATSSEGTLDAPPPAQGGATGAIQVYVSARQRAWVRVTVDGDISFEGIVLPGSAYPFSGDDSIELLTGNGAALQVYYNQQNMGTMGLFGEVVNRIFTAEGIQTPTPTITPTPTETPRITPTSSATSRAEQP